MKYTFGLCILLIFVLSSCETENIDDENFNSVEAKGNRNIVLDDQPIIIRECLIKDADRCPFDITDGQPNANFWWPENPTDYFNPESFYSSDVNNKLIFREYSDGTASITGTTVQGSCIVEVDVWLKSKLNWLEWSNAVGGHKKEGCAGDDSNEEEMHFYVINSEKSSITANGGDCISEGTFGVEQRPDPNDLETPNYGAHIGPGGANYDSVLNALGLSTWGWITDMTSGDRLWVMDFNFTLECESNLTGCETAYARGDNGNTCFIGEGFGNWGWTIGPLTEGDYSYDIYAGAGQCDISKGVFVGTVDVSYTNGEVNVTYNIDKEYEVKETHTYAGNNMFPTKKNGQATVAPGQYTIESNLNGDIFVIAHAVVCE